MSTNPIFAEKFSITNLWAQKSPSTSTPDLSVNLDWWMGISYWNNWFFAKTWTQWELIYSVWNWVAKCSIYDNWVQMSTTVRYNNWTWISNTLYDKLNNIWTSKWVIPVTIGTTKKYELKCEWWYYNNWAWTYIGSLPVKAITITATN